MRKFINYALAAALCVITFGVSMLAVAAVCVLFRSLIGVE